MQVKLVDGAVVIEPTNPVLSARDFAESPLTVVTEPAFYAALGATGLMERSVSVTVADRRTVAALVGNWIAEGYQPLPCDLKTYAKHVRALVAARKPKDPEGEVQAQPDGQAPAI